MTDEDLDAARVEEAERRFDDPGRSGLDDADWGRHVALIAARLARENWTPTDPDLVLAREAAASVCEEMNQPAYVVASMRSGLSDHEAMIRSALAAIRATRAEGKS